MRLAEETDGYLKFQVSDVMYGTRYGGVEDIRDGSAATEVDADEDGLYVDLEEMADWREAGAVVRVVRR